jgi:hypothetical protein
MGYDLQTGERINIQILKSIRIYLTEAGEAQHCIECIIWGEV